MRYTVSLLSSKNFFQNPELPINFRIAASTLRNAKLLEDTCMDGSSQLLRIVALDKGHSLSNQ